MRAVCDRGIDVESILVITYTRKAAGELRTRIRAALRERGRPDLARELDGAWISTIHGFCNRLLRAHPFAAGLDPRFRELEDAGAAVLRGEAFERALEEFCADGDPERLRLLATYRADGLRRMLTGVYETLRSAGRELVLELGERAEHRERRRRRLRAEAERARGRRVGDGDAAAERGRGAAGRDRAARRRSSSSTSRRSRVVAARAASFEPARKAVERAALEELAARDRDLLQELLERFGAEYAAAKRRESVVDFEDLQLAARDLLRDDASVREATQLRFRMVMVDEFQDTNRLQCELIDLVAHPELTEVFTVGDEFQSIYGFRHADLEVFRERRAQAPTLLALTRNYRSRPQVLAAVNHLFGDAFGDDYQPLAASAEFADPVFGHPVELLVTRQDELRRHEASTGAPARRARSRAACASSSTRARRSPARSSSSSPPAPTPSATRRRFAAKVLPTFRATGRGYFGQQQVVDLLAYLRLLHNRYDDVALATVLASPFVGVSNDALVLLRRNAHAPPAVHGARAGASRAARPERRAPASGVPPALRAARPRVGARSGSRRCASGSSSEHDYDLAVLARWDGTRRFANLRKLGRLARDYEAVRGADIEGFVRFVREQDALGAKELEAVAEEEGGGAVRLLTIHAREGPRVQGRDRRGRGARRRWAARPGRDRRALGRALRVPDGAPDARRSTSRVFGWDEVQRGSRRPGARRAAPPVLRRDDAGDRPPDRLRRDRPRANGGSLDADRLGAGAPRRARDGRRGRRRRRSSSIAARRASSSR